MKIVVICAGELIGRELVAELGARGHQPVAASPDAGVDPVTGEGLADALAGASVVVDVSNSRAPEDLDTATRNLLAAEAAAGVGHHVAVSLVDAQHELIAASSLPYTIVRATWPSAVALAEISVGPPVNGAVEPQP